MILGSCHKSARAEPRAARSHGRNLACRVLQTRPFVALERGMKEKNSRPGGNEEKC